MSDQGPSLFPLQEMMLICNGCGGERQIPRDELDAILTVADFDRFTKGRISIYSCKCGGTKCDIRLLPSEAAMESLRHKPPPAPRDPGEGGHDG